MTPSSDRTTTEPGAIVIGGGISGLACAHRLLSLRPDVSVTIIEASERLGGKVLSERVGGFVVDAAPDVCIGDKLRRTALYRALDLSGEMLRVNPDSLPTFERRGRELYPLGQTFSGELATFRGGMQAIVEMTVEALGAATIVSQSSVTRIARAPGGWRVDVDGADSLSMEAPVVVVALPAHAAATLLAPVVPQASAIADLPYPATTTVSLAWNASDVAHPLHGTGYLIAGAGEGDVTACTWTSRKVPSHAPAGTVLLRGYVRGKVQDPASMVLAEVRDTLGIVAAPLFTRVYEWAKGIPEYSAEHVERVVAIESALRWTPGLFIAGSAFHGVGVPDCILSGESAAAAAVSHLNNRGIAGAA